MHGKGATGVHTTPHTVGIVFRPDFVTPDGAAIHGKGAFGVHTTAVRRACITADGAAIHGKGAFGVHTTTHTVVGIVYRFGYVTADDTAIHGKGACGVHSTTFSGIVGEAGNLAVIPAVGQGQISGNLNCAETGSGRFDCMSVQAEVQCAAYRLLCAQCHIYSQVIVAGRGQSSCVSPRSPSEFAIAMRVTGDMAAGSVTGMVCLLHLRKGHGGQQAAHHTEGQQNA